jgi:thiamine biosynthesis lipoprotein
MKAPGSDGAALELSETSGVHCHAHEAMATVFEVRSAHADARYAAQAAHAAFALLDRLEQELSRFIPNSDIARVNQLEKGGAARVSESTMECLVIARHMFELTGGAFDVAVGTGLDRLELDPERLTVHALEDGARLDLGGIGKGFAVDRMAALLVEWGLERSLVHGGWSSVAALEPPPEWPGWPLGMSAPPGSAASPRLVARVEARQQALSASGTRKGDHIVDPRTGRAVAERAVWVRVPVPQAQTDGLSPAAVADALSTAFMILPTERIDELCRTNPGLEAWRLETAELVHLGATARGRV